KPRIRQNESSWTRKRRSKTPNERCGKLSRISGAARAAGTARGGGGVFSSRPFARDSITMTENPLLQFSGRHEIDDSLLRDLRDAGRCQSQIHVFKLPRMVGIGAQ